MHVGLGAGSRTGAADLGVGEDLNGLLFDLPRWLCQSLTPELSRTAHAAERCGTRYHKVEAAKRSRLERIVRFYSVSK